MLIARLLREVGYRTDPEIRPLRVFTVELRTTHSGTSLFRVRFFIWCLGRQDDRLQIEIAASIGMC